MKKAAIIDYKAGNLKNVYTALNEIGFETKITNNSKDLDSSDLIVLPGVGAFPDAMKNLENTGLIESIKKNVNNEKPLLGICLGMQMLFDKSFEISETNGLGFIPGEVVPFKINELYPGSKIPHMGWNELKINHKDDTFVKNINDGDFVYFVHSYYVKPKNFDQNVVAWADYKVKVPGVVRNNNIIGTQFHPEKSSRIGAQMLKNLKEAIEK